MIKKILLLITFFGLFLPFQNCAEFGSVIVLDQNLSLNNSGGSGGNGGGYDIKLTFIINYKDQKIIGDSLVMYSGETMNFQINNGLPPFTFNYIGQGTFDSNELSYTSPFYAHSPQFESIEVTDSVGAKGTISIQINSFYGQNKLMYPQNNSVASHNYATPIVLDSNENAYTIVNYDKINSTNLSPRRHSILLVSSDKGSTWNQIREFGFDSKVYVNPFNNNLFVIDPSNLNSNFYFSKNKGSTWELLKFNSESQKINLNDKFIQYTMLDIIFVSAEKIILLGSQYSNGIFQWKTFLSNDNGESFNSVDDFQAFENKKGTASIGLVTASKVVYIAGRSAQMQKNMYELNIRISKDLGQSFSSDFIFSYSPLDEYISNNPVGLVEDQNGNIYCSVDISGLKNSKWILFKKNFGEKSWQKVNEYSYNQQASRPLLNIGILNELYIRSFGFDLNGSHDILLKSIDQGKTWITMYDKLIDIAPYDWNLYPTAYTQFKDGTFLISSSFNIKTKNQINFKRSTDNGVTWINASSFQAINKEGGDFIATSLIQYDEKIFFMAGKGKNPLNNLVNLWVVLKSTDGGNTWTESDRYSSLYNNDYNSEAKSIFKDSAGFIYVVGTANDNKNHPNWSVRRSTDLGLTWKTVDEFTSAEDSFGVYYNSANSITENNKGEIFILGSIYHNSISLTTPRTQKSLIRKSVDRGNSWITIDSYGKFTFPHLIKNCFDNVLFEIISSSEFSYWDLIRRSDDNGLTWTELKTSDGVKSIICNNKNEVIILSNYNTSYSVLNLNNSNKILKHQSFDKGLTWTEDVIQFKDTRLNNFFVSTIASDDNYFWLGGKTLGESENWTIVKSSLDFKESYIVDTFVDPKAKANVESVINCQTGICAIGNTYDPNKDQGIFSLFRFISFK